MMKYTGPERSDELVLYAAGLALSALQEIEIRITPHSRLISTIRLRLLVPY